MALGGFFFDVDSFLASMSVQRMSFAEKGVYLAMLFQEWTEVTKSLPDNVDAVIEKIALTDEHAAEVRAAWLKVRTKFVQDRRDNSRIYNVRLERTRRQQAQNLRKRVAAGRIGGKASAAKRMEDLELAINDRSTDVEPPSTDKKGLDRIGLVVNQEPPNPLSAKGGRVKRAERKRAEEILKIRFGRCNHEPEHIGNREACLLAIVGEFRAKAS